MAFPTGLTTHVVASATLEGRTQLRRSLAELSLGVRLRIAVDVVAAGGRVLVGPMRAAAPDETLARSIATVVRTYRRGGIAVSLTGPTWPLGAHGMWREKGTKDRYTRRGQYRGRIEKTPFVEPTWHTYRGRVQRLMAKTLADGIEREVRG